MTLSFFHGVEVVQIDDGLRSIQTVSSAVIGLIGTAPDAAGSEAATLTLGSGVVQTALLFTAVTPGVAGNAISISITAEAGNDLDLEVSVDGNAISVRLGTDGAGVMNSTAADVAALISATPEAAALVDVSDALGSDGSGLMTTTVGRRLMTGGADIAFPLNTPVLIAGNRLDAAKLGSTGTLPRAIDGIFDQGGAQIVVIRVEEGASEADTTANIIGGTNPATGKYEGLQAFLEARPTVFVMPRILIAPGFTDQVAVVSELIQIAERLRAVIIADGPNTTDAAAVRFRQNFGSDRVYIVDPWVTVFDTTTQQLEAEWPSARVAGLIARVDTEKGFWHSPSNHEIYGITGTSRKIDWGYGDENARGNLLNADEVTTIIQRTGYRLWGNRTTASDPLWAFLSVRRTADMVYESIEQALLWALDRPFSLQLLNDIRDSAAAYLRSLEARGAILGGSVWIDPELNSEVDLKAGKLTVDFDIEPPAPLERLTFRAHRNGAYYEELVASIAYQQG